MTDALVDAIRMLLAIALLLSGSVGLGFAGWQALRYLVDAGRTRPRLIALARRPTPGREPLPPRSGLAWRHGRFDHADHPTRDDTSGQ
ncbi:hypothetical protein BJ122_106140 [Rhodopseudomonas faecalis]|uniref:Uncharacterized protein n=1 Tax=Rhodopseudomonas faecalis TaxID=99655 RepID=A0A318TP29_9BRAD|nr:hypothetical protein [Rhodopseudomonas faecalis]PYF03645.1 hypothetical protein BJ122_106140 [Rhodopseudomonas faecalis]